MKALILKIFKPMEVMDKWYYINKVSKLSDKYGDKLLEMMDLFKKR